MPLRPGEGHSAGLEKLLDNLPEAARAFERRVDYWESLYLQGRPAEDDP
jgi:hypothetical protein